MNLRIQPNVLFTFVKNIIVTLETTTTSNMVTTVLEIPGMSLIFLEIPGIGLDYSNCPGKIKFDKNVFATKHSLYGRRLASILIDVQGSS